MESEDNEAAKSIAWSLFHACTRSEGPHFLCDPTNRFNNQSYCTTALGHWNSGICIKDSILNFGHPLYFAARSGNLVMVGNLLRAGVDVNAEGGPLKNSRDDHDTFNRTALHAAAYRGHLEVVKMLLEHKDSDINRIHMPTPYDQSNHRGAIPLTPLAYAVVYNHVSVVKFLLKKGADTNVQLVTPAVSKQYAHQRGVPNCEAALIVARAQSRCIAQVHQHVLNSTKLPEALLLLIESFIYYH